MNAIVSTLRGDESALWGIEKDEEWRNAWSRLIAYAWMSEENLIEAISKPIPTMYKVSKYCPPAGLILRVCGTTNGGVLFTDEWPKVTNWKVNAEKKEINVKKGFKFNNKNELTEALNQYAYDSTEITTGDNGWEELGRNLPTEIVLTIPPKPAESDVRTFALADYQATGKTFPFTS